MEVKNHILYMKSLCNKKDVYIKANDMIFELILEENNYLFEIKRYESEIHNVLCFDKDIIQCEFYCGEEILKNIVDGVKTVECEDNKYRFIIFNDIEGITRLNIQFTDRYKNELEKKSKNIIEKLEDIDVRVLNSSIIDNNYHMDFSILDKNGEIINIKNLLKEEDCEENICNIELLYTSRKDNFKLESIEFSIKDYKSILETLKKDESSVRLNKITRANKEKFNLINIKEYIEAPYNYKNHISKEDTTYSYITNIEELHNKDIVNGIYDVYIKISLYKIEKRVRVKCPNTEQNLILKENIINKKDNDIYNMEVYYEEDLGLTFNIEKSVLKFQADVVDLEVENGKNILTLKVMSNYGNPFKNKLIDDINLEIRKRSSSLNEKIINYRLIDEEEATISIEINNSILKDLSLGIWDLFLNIISKGDKIEARVRNYDEIENKKDILLFRYIYINNKNKYVIPYYTLDDHLSLEIKEKISVKKVHYLKLENKRINIKLEVSHVGKEEISEDTNLNLYMLGFDLSKTNINAEFKIKNINDSCYLLDITTDVIENADSNEFKNNLYTNKIYIDIELGKNIYPLSLTLDYSKIFIEEIDEKIQNKKYKIRNKILYKLMRQFLPIKKNLVVLQSFGGRSYSGNPKYLYEYAEKNYKDLDFVWALRNQFEEIKGRAKKVKIESLKYYYYLARAEYIVSNLNMQNSVRKRKGSKFIQTWHGTPLKKISFDVDKKSPSYDAKFLRGFQKRVSKWDILLSQSKYATEKFRSAFRYEGKIAETGHPINDILVENNPNKIKEIKEKLNINTDKKIILYAPTWRDNSKYVLDIDIDKMYKELKDDYILLIKTHYFVNTALDTGSFKGFVYDVSKYEDIQELALISDMLITDYSSVMFDYASTNKPMIFYCHDLEYYKGKLRGFYVDFEEEAPGEITKTTEELVEAIKNIDEANVKYKEKYKEFYNKYAYLEDGKSSKRAAVNVFKQKKKRKIYFLSFNIFGMGGTGRTVINTATSLIQSGYDVEIISVFGDRSDQYFEIDEAIKVSLLLDKKKKKTRIQRILHSMPSILINKDDEFYKDFSLLTDIRILKKLLRLRNGILVSTRPGFNVMLGKYFKIRLFKVIGQEHLNYNIHTKYLQKQIKKYYKKLDLIMTLTDADTEEYIREIPSIKNKLIKVPNAIPNLEEIQGIERKNQIIAAGRLVPQKGFDLLIKAAPKVIEKHPDWVIKIFGKGRELQYLKELIIKNGVEKNVLLMGPTKTIEKEMAESKIYVLSSRYEGFGMVIIEAMKMQVPVVSFDCPEGPGEIITNNEDGLLVENGDINKLAEAMNKLIEDESLRERLVHNANRNVREYNIENITSLWIESLDSL